MIATVALETHVFQKLIFFQIKLNLPIHFNPLHAPIRFFSFTLDTNIQQGNVKFLNIDPTHFLGSVKFSILHVHCTHNREFCEVVTSPTPTPQLACIEHLRCPYAVPKCPA